jgi:hypothetical protein
VRAELIPILKDEFISVRKFPALTVCHENDLEKIFSDDKTFLDLIILNSKQNISENQKFLWNKDIETMVELPEYAKYRLNQLLKDLKKSSPNNYKQILQFIINYMKFGTNESLKKYSTTIDEMKFFSNHFNCFIKINQTFNCSEIREIVPNFSFLGKCNTFLFKLREKFGPNYELRFMNNENILSITGQRPTLPHYLINRLYIHSSESMPSLTHYDWTSITFYADVEFSEYNFKKLEYPYDTHCRKYNNKTRAECLNECYKREQIANKNCIKNEELLFVLNVNIAKNVVFIALKTCKV